MMKKDRVVFSRFPAPGENIVQEIYREYQKFIDDLQREFITGARRSFDIRTKIHWSTTRCDFIPIVSESLTLNVEDHQHLQLCENFFLVYRKLRTRLIADMISRHDSSLIIKYRMYAISGLVHLMNEGELDGDSLQLFTQLYNHQYLRSEEFDPVSSLLSDSGYERWGYWDLRGVVQQGWWEYVRKLHKPKPMGLAARHGIQFANI